MSPIQPWLKTRQQRVQLLIERIGIAAKLVFALRAHRAQSLRQCSGRFLHDIGIEPQLRGGAGVARGIEKVQPNNSLRTIRLIESLDGPCLIAPAAGEDDIGEAQAIAQVRRDINGFERLPALDKPFNRAEPPADACGHIGQRINGRENNHFLRRRGTGRRGGLAAAAIAPVRNQQHCQE